MEPLFSSAPTLFSEADYQRYAHPPIKMSSNGICHIFGSTYYYQVRRFRPFKTLEECLKAGGRMPKK